MARSFRASKEGLKKAEIAFNLKGCSQEYIAGATQTSRPTVGNFFARRSVDKQLFQAICTELGLEWYDIADLESNELKPASVPALDDLVKTVRSHVHDSIQMRCGTMRVLDMSQPIALTDIYTTVNILESVRGRQRRAIAKLAQHANDRDFNLLDPIQEERISGLTAVEKYSKLIILGQPGAGKTTFLKWLAIQCNSGQLWSDLIPIFVSLKAFAEAKGVPDLLNYIQKQWAECGVTSPQAAETVLQQGQAVVLLDGLDEVRETDYDRILQEIREFSTRFHTCRLVMTCRIAAGEYTFEQFTEVEIAEFNDTQIRDFVTKWFEVKADLVKAEQFIQKLQANPWIKDLATNSLLLTLLCLVFGESDDFSVNRAELFREGLNILLKKWDTKRNIKRDTPQNSSEIYQGLSLACKEALLSQIAFTTFDRGHYFFKQQAVEQAITDFVCTLPGIPENSNGLELDSEAILKSIEAQQGLLVERARSIYSFSHLVFQEYFTAKKIASSPKTQALIEFKNLVAHLTEIRWREVFLLTVCLLPQADDLLLMMKVQIDRLLFHDDKLQQFLVWLNKKAASGASSYRTVTVRSHYAYLVTGNARARAICLMTANDAASSLAKASDFHIADNRASNVARTIANNSVSTLTQSDNLVTMIAIATDIAEALSSDISSAMEIASSSDISSAILVVMESAIGLAPTQDLEQSLRDCRDQLPDPEGDPIAFTQWWQNASPAWIKQLKQFMIQYRNLEYDWQFTESQTSLLEQYYRANHLLLECLNDCYASPEVRDEIELTLLWSIAEIEQHQQSQPFHSSTNVPQSLRVLGH